MLIAYRLSNEFIEFVKVQDDDFLRRGLQSDLEVRALRQVVLVWETSLWHVFIRFEAEGGECCVEIAHPDDPGALDIAAAKAVEELIEADGVRIEGYRRVYRVVGRG